MSFILEEDIPSTYSLIKTELPFNEETEFKGFAIFSEEILSIEDAQSIVDSITLE